MKVAFICLRHTGTFVARIFVRHISVASLPGCSLLVVFPFETGFDGITALIGKEVFVASPFSCIAKDGPGRRHSILSTTVGFALSFGFRAKGGTLTAQWRNLFPASFSRFCYLAKTGFSQILFGAMTVEPAQCVLGSAPTPLGNCP